jgi:hypothetical protein
VNPESPLPSSLRRRLILWIGAFLLPFFLAALVLLFPATQRYCLNLVLRIYYHGGSIRDVRLGFHHANLLGVRLPTNDGALEIQNIFIEGKWWQFLHGETMDNQQILLDHIQYLPKNSLTANASRPFGLSVTGGIQYIPLDDRPYVGNWRIQSFADASPPVPGVKSVPVSASSPAVPSQIDFNLQLRSRDLTVPGVQPFALAYATGSFDMGFLWNYSPGLGAEHDQLATQLALQFSQARVSQAKLGAALRLLDSPQQHWKIFATFTSVSSGGISWQIHATLWADADLAGDLSVLNLLEHSPDGQPVTDNTGLQQGPTILLSGLNNQLTSENLNTLYLQMLQ